VQTSAKDSVKPDPTTARTMKFAVQHYTVDKIASLWNLSEGTIRRLFKKEPDVLVIGNHKPRFGRQRRSTLRIRKFVVEGVHGRQSRP